MPFSKEVIGARFWQYAVGRCECIRRCPTHAGRRCNRVLDPNNQKPGMQWHSHHVISQDDGGPDTLTNCQVLCLDCHKNTENYGGR